MSSVHFYHCYQSLKYYFVSSLSFSQNSFQSVQEYYYTSKTQMTKVMKIDKLLMFSTLKSKLLTRCCMSFQNSEKKYKNKIVTATLYFNFIFFGGKRKTIFYIITLHYIYKYYKDLKPIHCRIHIFITTKKIFITIENIFITAENILITTKIS